MELPKTEEIPASKGQDGQEPEPEDSQDPKNELNNDIMKAVVKVESNGELNDNINGGLTNDINSSAEVKKEFDGSVIANQSKAKVEPLENGVGNKVDETETETIAPTDREFVLTTKNLERVREDLRQEEVLHGKKSPLKSVSASPNKHELIKSESNSTSTTTSGHKSSSSSSHRHHSSSSSNRRSLRSSLNKSLKASMNVNVPSCFPKVSPWPPKLSKLLKGYRLLHRRQHLQRRQRWQHLRQHLLKRRR